MRSVSGMARCPERRPLEAKAPPPKLSWETSVEVLDVSLEVLRSAGGLRRVWCRDGGVVVSIVLMSSCWTRVAHRLFLHTRNPQAQRIAVPSAVRVPIIDMIVDTRTDFPVIETAPVP